MHARPTYLRLLRARWSLAVALFVCAVAVTSCLTQDGLEGERHRWWAGLGPVLPHDSFPADCSLCHVGASWNELVPDFAFDHAEETGYALEGAHGQAQCLRCHNDRGPVRTFAQQGCAGCHSDVHQGDLGPSCTSCHTEDNWRPVGMVERHNRTRFPLVGAHAAVSCHRCHPGARVGNFLPVNPECLTCHTDDLQRTTNPPHLGLGWVDNCERCHAPTAWSQARIR